VAEPVAVAAPSRRRNWSGLGVGVVTGYLSVIVLIPLAALVWEAHKGGLAAFWSAISSAEAVSAIELTLVASVIVAAVNAVAGKDNRTSSSMG